MAMQGERIVQTAAGAKHSLAVNGTHDTTRHTTHGTTHTTRADVNVCACVCVQRDRRRCSRSILRWR
jgi:hypothetical protein